MGKIQRVMELYEEVFPNVSELEQAGTWIKVYPGNGDPPSSYRSDDLLEEIFEKTGNMYEWDSELKSLYMVAAHSDALWDTKDSWDTSYPWAYGENPKGKEEEENLFDDIGEI